MSKGFHVLHFIKSGKGWHAVAMCGTRFPRLCLGTDDLQRFKNYSESESDGFCCDRCKAALIKAGRLL